MPCAEASLFPLVIRCLVSLFSICIPAPCQRRTGAGTCSLGRGDACPDLLNLCACYRNPAWCFPPLLSAAVRRLCSRDPACGLLASSEAVKGLKTYWVQKFLHQESGSCSILGNSEAAEAAGACCKHTLQSHTRARSLLCEHGHAY